MIATMIGALALAASAPQAVTIPGPSGPLAGTMLAPDKPAAIIVIIPGSGPTDRDGNNPLGVTAATYRLLAEALAEKGIATLRIDKRGLFGSKAAIPDPNVVTIAAYADDARRWAAEAAKRSGKSCAWILGHSEGALVALQAAQQPAGICGVILVSGGGRPLGTVLREQLRANPANAPILDAAFRAIGAFEAGKTVDEATLPAPIRPLFNARVQPYLIDLFAHDPAKLASKVAVPMLIVQGTRDVQVSVADGKVLAAAQPRATLRLLPNVNHVLKTVASDDRAANLASYADPSLPVAPPVVTAIADFVKAAK